MAQQQYRNGNTSGPLYELEPKDPMYILDNPWREMLEAHDYPEPLEPVCGSFSNLKFRRRTCGDLSYFFEMEFTLLMQIVLKLATVVLSRKIFHHL